jgi:uncharacterized YccA/Bax inhibitor family protein
MSLFKSGNPVLSDKTFGNITTRTSDTGLMTINGTLNKFGFTALMLVAGAAFSWVSVYENASYAPILMWGGLIVGFILALIISFKPTTAPMLVPAYGVLEGLFLGGISAMYNYVFEAKMPNIVTNAVGLTIATVAAMYFLYKFKVIKATERFKSVLFTATASVALFYVIVMIARLCGAEVAFMHDSSTLGIGLSLLIVGIAALNLIVDFDRIEQGAEQGAPKYMEWYGAFGLMVTIVWLYLEILRLLSRFASRD